MEAKGRLSARRGVSLICFILTDVCMTFDSLSSSLTNPYHSNTDIYTFTLLILCPPPLPTHTIQTQTYTHFAALCNLQEVVFQELCQLEPSIKHLSSFD